MWVIITEKTLPALALTDTSHERINIRRNLSRLAVFGRRELGECVCEDPLFSSVRRLPSAVRLVLRLPHQMELEDDPSRHYSCDLKTDT